MHDRPKVRLVRTGVPREVVILLVKREVGIDQVLVLQRPAHHPGIGDRQAVVREADRAGVAKLSHLGQHLTLHAAGDAGQEAGGHRRLLGGALPQRADVRRGVHRRLGVGHREDAAEAARGRRPGARPDVLLVLVPGRPQVDVGVEERREHCLALGVDQLAFACVDATRGGKFGDPAVANDDVMGAIDPRTGIEHRGATEHQVARGLSAPVSPLERRDRLLHAGSLIGVGSGRSSDPLGPVPPGRGRSAPVSSS